jgi:UPF0716 protein FxsA
VPIVYLIGFILWIWAEIEVFVALGSAAGVLLTLIGIFVTGMIGISLLRSQGRRITGSLQAQLARGEAPVASLAAGVSVLVGAVLMLIPGYLTDAAGLVLFLPVIRTIVGALILKRITARGSFTMGARMPFGGRGPFGDPPGNPSPPPPGRNTATDIIEGDFEERPANTTPIDKKD